MLVLLSPSKTLDFETDVPITHYSVPKFKAMSENLINDLKDYSVQEIASMMNISDKLAELNFDRFQTWTTSHTLNNAKQALFAFKGDVYDGLDAYSLTPEQIGFANNHVRILSGLYGILSPLDLIMPYRLEMGRKLPRGLVRSLYEYWDGILVPELNKSVLDNNCIINLASKEYFSAIDEKRVESRIITPTFKELKNGTYKVVSLNAKKARGTMTRKIIEGGILNPEDLKTLEINGYIYNEAFSSGREFVYVRV